MVENQDIMDVLETLGLNSYERKLYLALLNKGTSTAGKLSELAGVPRSRTYDVLESLADKGFVVIKSSKPIEYVAVEPKEALERTKKRFRREYEEMANRVDKLKETEIVDEMANIHKDSMKTLEPGELTGTLKGNYMVLEQLETMLKNSKEEANIVLTPNSLKQFYSSYGPLLEKLSNRGVSIKIAVPFAGEIENIIQELNQYAEIRDLSKFGGIAGRFAVVDGEEVLLGLTHDEEVHPTQDMGFWTKSDHLASGLFKSFFETIWESL